MNKLLICFIVGISTIFIAVYVSDVIVLFTALPHDYYDFAAEKTTVVVLVLACITTSNSIISYILLYVIDTRWPYDYLLTLMVIFEAVTSLFSLGTYIMSITIHKAWIYEVRSCLYTLGLGPCIFAIYCPVIAIGLELYQEICSIRGRISMKALLTPLVTLSIITFLTTFILYAARDERQWLAAFTETVLYFIPAVAVLVLLIALKVKCWWYKSPREDTTMEFQYNAFAALSISFVALFGPMSVGQILVTHSIETFGANAYEKYGKFYVITASLTFLKYLFNLPLLLIFDVPFRRGCFKLLRGVFPCCRRLLDNSSSQAIHYSMQDDRVLIDEEE